MVDKITTDQWVILELGPKAEGEDPDVIRQSIRHSIRDAEVFIPASVTQNGEDRVVQYLVEGYAFVRRTHPDSIYLRLENSRYVQGVVKKPGYANGSSRPVRQIACITDAEIENFRKQLRVEVDQGIGVGDTVLITSGAYRQITATVEEEIPEKDAVQVYIKLRSKQALITLPRACLRLVSKAQRSPLLERAEGLRDWLRGVRAALAWPKDAILRVMLPYETFRQLDTLCSGARARAKALWAYDAVLDVGQLQARRDDFERLDLWTTRGQELLQGLRAYNTSLDAGPLQVAQRRFELVDRLVVRKKELLSSITPAYNPPSLSALETKYLEYQYIEDVFDRLGVLSDEVDSIERSLQSRGARMTAQNVVIDGLQLAIRCALVPGLNTLKDKQGRPTGAILGFLQSMGSLRKRFEGAAFHVTWDGSSKRRRAMYDGYKANRSAHVPMAFETEWLRECLPYFGVHQAWNPDEEADDVIATLLRGPLKGQNNVFVSTDRDLLQLVTQTDHQFVPAVGAGKEKHFDVDAVLQEYGVRPEEMPHVRALSGDDSDNIPGAQGFGLKTAAKLVRLYGTVDRIFASNLAGLSKVQYTSLRSSEKQVRLNVELMKLHDDLPLTVLRSDPNQIAATQRLQDVDIKPDSILATFFGRAE